MGETDCPQNKAAEVASPRVVIHDLTVVTETTALEVDETTPSDPMIRDHILNQLVENIASDLLLEDVRGTTSPASSEPAKSVEKKRKASATDFDPARYKVKTKKATRYVQMKKSYQHVP